MRQIKNDRDQGHERTAPPYLVGESNQRRIENARPDSETAARDFEEEAPRPRAARARPLP